MIVTVFGGADEVAIASAQTFTATVTANYDILDDKFESNTTTAKAVFTLAEDVDFQVDDQNSLNGVTITASGNTAGSLIYGVDSAAQGDSIVGGNGVDILSGFAGADTINGGLGADIIDGGAEIDTIILTESTAASDVVIGAEAAANRDNITGFTAGATGDKFKISLDGNGVVANNAVSKIQAQANAAAVTMANSANVLTLGVSNNDDTFDADGTNVLATSLGGNTITTEAAGDKIVIVQQNQSGTQTALYHGNANADTALVATEILLVAVLDGALAGTWANENVIGTGA